MMAELMRWSIKSGPSNLFNFENHKGRFDVPDKELSAINTITKYLRALDVQRVTFIL